jgi:acyl-CoA reductase-like NAD-dependent aldehyde dehydrogenase
MKEYKLFVAGEWVPTKSGKIFENINPATGKAFAAIHAAGPDEVETAISSAVTEQKDWALFPAAEKKQFFYRCADFLSKNVDKYVDDFINESGATYQKAYGELSGGASTFMEGAKTVDLITGEVLHTDANDQLSYYVRQPVGVVGGIAPFNFPFALALNKVVYALATGNTIVLKPSSETPISGLIIAEIMSECGLPAGCLSVIPGPGKIVGDAISNDPRIGVISFTGSAAVGAEIARCASEKYKKYTLELGGKNPLIVLSDYDVDAAVENAVMGSFWHNGQICMATSRIIVEEPIYDEFCAKLAEKAQALKVGDPHEKDTFIGPLINDRRMDEIDGFISRAVDKGARVLCGFKHEGAFYHPTVVADVTQEMDIFYEECFAPVTSVVKARNWKDALELCNDNKYGLSSALLTNDLNKALTMAPQMESGCVHVNNLTITVNGFSPFGGLKNSGVGRELGPQFSIEEFTEVKWITIDYNKPE